MWISGLQSACISLAMLTFRGSLNFAWSIPSRQRLTTDAWEDKGTASGEDAASTAWLATSMSMLRSRYCEARWSR